MNNETPSIAIPDATTASAPMRPFRPSMRFFHPNLKGTGCAVKLTLIPAHDVEEGVIMATVARQVAIANRLGPAPTFARFDWENAICVKLGFTDICKMLQVFRGHCESLEDGKGILHRSACGLTRIVLRHLLDPVQGYSFELYRTKPDGTDARAHILFTTWEALGIAESIAGSMAVLNFGIPFVLPSEQPVVNTAARGNRDAHAA